MNVMMDNRGFSLVELMIALLILAIGLLAVAQMQILSIQGSTGSSRITEATHLLQDEIEKFRQPSAFLKIRTATGFTNSAMHDHLIDRNPGNNNDLDSTTSYDYAETIVMPPRNNEYTRYVNIKNICDGPSYTSCSDYDVLMKEVNVIVKWVEGGIEHKISSRTIVSGKDREFF